MIFEFEHPLLGLYLTSEQNFDYQTYFQLGFSFSFKEKEKETGHYIRRERYAGSCQRSFYVGKDVTEEDIKASFKHGILKLTIPKKEANPAVENKKQIAIEG